MTKSSDPHARKKAIASVLRFIELSTNERTSLQLLYESPQGLPYKLDASNRPQSPAVQASKTVGSRIKRALETNYGYGMNWVGHSSGDRLWVMNDDFRAAIDEVELFPRVEVDGLSDAMQEFEDKIERSLGDTSRARLKRLATADQVPNRVAVTTYVYIRNPDVVAEALFRAQGKCESCGCDAPFLKRSNQEPYLEVHHRVQLALGGMDSLDNAIALCPNCHRKSHYG